MIGIDIVDIKRFKLILKGDFERWQRCFSKEEWEYSFSHAVPAERLASTFAAKEAVLKAMGCKVELNHIEISRQKDGRPVAFINRKKSAVELAISHDGGVAVAVAFLRNNDKT